MTSPKNALVNINANRFLVIGAYPDSIVSFRGDLILTLKRAGCDLTICTAPPTSSDVQRDIDSLGVQHCSYPVARNSLSVRADLATWAALRRLFRELQPLTILAYTVKPIIWGGIASRAVRNISFYAMVTGLGYAFQGTSLKRRLLNKLVVVLYWYALRRAKGVVFQNTDNRDLFIAKKIVPASKCHVVNGSGIQVNRFQQQPLPDGPPTFLLIARLLGEKGIREYAAAAASVKQRFPTARFQLVGPTDPSPDGLPLAQIQAWHDAGTIEYLGATYDVRPYLNACHVYCLPSYHEGMPRTVLEAMATGRPILTTDTSGCRETVVPGRNGWLVPPKDALALAERMVWFLEHPQAWLEMATASRELAVEKFDVEKVNAALLQILGIDPQTTGAASAV